MPDWMQDFTPQELQALTPEQIEILKAKIQEFTSGDRPLREL